MKFLIPNYRCFQNPWIGGYRPQIPVLSVLKWICWTPPPEKKILGTPLLYALALTLGWSVGALHVRSSSSAKRRLRGASFRGPIRWKVERAKPGNLVALGHESSSCLAETFKSVVITSLHVRTLICGATLPF